MTTSPKRLLPAAFLFKYSFPVMYDATADQPFYGKQSAKRAAAGSVSTKSISAELAASKSGATTLGVTKPVAGKARSTAASAAAGLSAGREDVLINGWKSSQLTSIPCVNELDDAQPFAQLAAVWNERGLGLRAMVGNKRRKPVSANNIEFADGLHICVDTRNMQTVHRATRFCVLWRLLAAGGPGNMPYAVHQPINRAKEEPRVDTGDPPQLLLESFNDGYCLDVWLPAGALPGFDPASSPKLGFSCMIADSEHEEQHVALDLNFPMQSDPSMWCTLDLQRGE